MSLSESNSREKRLEAELVLVYDSHKHAKTICEAVSPDNSKTPKDLSIKTTTKGKKVVTCIGCDKITTLIATIDDLMSCVSMAEKTLLMIKKME